MYSLVSAGKRIPIRLPLGADSFGMISMDIESVKKDLEEFKGLSLGLGNQIDSVEFLKKMWERQSGGDALV